MRMGARERPPSTNTSYATFLLLQALGGRAPSTAVLLSPQAAIIAGAIGFSVRTKSGLFLRLGWSSRTCPLGQRPATGWRTAAQGLWLCGCVSQYAVARGKEHKKKETKEIEGRAGKCVATSLTGMPMWSPPA
jgi:hypothetical protein